MRPSTLAALTLAATVAACAGEDPQAPIRPGTDGWPCPNDNNCLDGRRCLQGTCQTVAGDTGADGGGAGDAGPTLDAADGGEIDAGAEDTGVPCSSPATLTEIQRAIFGPDGQAHCNQANCHGQAEAGGLRLLPGPSLRADLLGPTSNPQAPERNLVVPGSPETSRLYVLMRDRNPAGGGQPMPPDAPVPFCDLETVRRWIAEGALDN